jgi:hypothetical protein
MLKKERLNMKSSLSPNLSKLRKELMKMVKKLKTMKVLMLVKKMKKLRNNQSSRKKITSGLFLTEDPRIYLNCSSNAKELIHLLMLRLLNSIVHHSMKLFLNV